MQRSSIRAEASTDNAPEQHGGNLAWIAAQFPEAPRPIIDLSTGINPYAYPAPPLPEGWMHRLPDVSELQVAQATAAGYYGAHEDAVCLASGMQPLIFALACLRWHKHGKTRVAVLSPAYSEHARIWEATGHEVMAVQAIEDIPPGEVLVITNPNNPDGHSFPSPHLLALADRLALRQGWLIVDEAFADVMPELSIIADAESKNNIAVLRSCGKFFGIAGLRVSAGIIPPAWREWVRMALGPWPISSAACSLLPPMYSDREWIDTMQIKLAEEAKAWREVLAQRFAIIGYTPLFTLIENDDAQAWYRQLAKQGIVMRKFASHPHWLRFGLPSRQDMKRIAKALAV